MVIVMEWWMTCWWARWGGRTRARVGRGDDRTVYTSKGRRGAGIVRLIASIRDRKETELRKRRKKEKKRRKLENGICLVDVVRRDDGCECGSWIRHEIPQVEPRDRTRAHSGAWLAKATMMVMKTNDDDKDEDMEDIVIREGRRKKKRRRKRR